MLKRVSWVVIVLALPAVLWGQPLVAFGDGTVNLTYQQFPFGPYSGSHFADGPAGGSAEFIEPGETQGCGGVLGSASSGHVFLGYGAIRNPDTSIDVAILFVFDDTSPIAPGTYGINLADLSCLFWFLDDVTQINIPTNLAEADWDDILGSVVAAHKFASISGSITVDELSGTSITGSFLGHLSDLDDPMTVIAVDDGFFELTQGIVPLTEASFGELKTCFR